MMLFSLLTVLAASGTPSPAHAQSAAWNPVPVAKIYQCASGIKLTAIYNQVNGTFAGFTALEISGGDDSLEGRYLPAGDGHSFVRQSEGTESLVSLDRGLYNLGPAGSLNLLPNRGQLPCRAL